MHPLDNVIWRALTTRQAAFAEVCDNSRRFDRDITSLCAFDAPSDAGYDALARLVGERGTAAVFLEKPHEARTGWEFVGGAPLLEMVCENGSDSRSAFPSNTEL